MGRLKPLIERRRVAAGAIAGVIQYVTLTREVGHGQQLARRRAHALRTWQASHYAGAAMIDIMRQQLRAYHRQARAERPGPFASPYAGVLPALLSNRAARRARAAAARRAGETVVA